MRRGEKTRLGSGPVHAGGYVVCPEGHTNVVGYDTLGKGGRIVAVTWVCRTCKRQHVVCHSEEPIQGTLPV